MTSWLASTRSRLASLERIRASGIATPSLLAEIDELRREIAEREEQIRERARLFRANRDLVRK